MARAPRTFRARFELDRNDLDKATDAEDIGGEGANDPSENSDRQPMTDEELSSLLDGQINDAKDYESSDLVRLRQKALQFFEGEVDIPSAPGRSSVVSRDVADTHGLIMPGLMRVFLATDRIAIYLPRMQTDEHFARQATDYVNYVVMSECEGYAAFRSAFHDALLMGNGILKHWWDDTPEYTTEDFSGLPEDAYQQLVQDMDVEKVLEHTEYDDPSWQPPPTPPIPLMGQPDQLPPNLPAIAAPKLHDCRVKRVCKTGHLRLMAIPPEDFLFGRGVISLDEDRTRFVAHRWVKTRSKLIEEGFDEDEVDELPAYSLSEDMPEKLARDRHHLFEGDVSPDKSTDLIEGYECYIRCDYDGVGVAQWRKVNVGGGLGARIMLSNDEWGDDLPFSDIVPDPVPHRWRGRSLLDQAEDVQRIKSVLMRQGLDSTYMSNNPRQAVAENQVVNPEVLADWEIGATIITRGDPNQAISWETTPFIADKTLQVMEYMDAVLEKRTGISRSSQALDLDALQDQTATAVNAAQAAAHTKVEEYARNIAEYGGLKRVFSKILKLVCKHQDRARTVRLRDDWINVDPRAWNADMDVTINTGLGSGSRERDLTMLTQIAAKQEQLALQLGPINPVVGIDRLMDTYRLMTEAAGLKPAERFFPEMDKQAMQQLADMMKQQGQNDPKAAAAQMQAQIDQQKAQQQGQLEQQKLQLTAQLEREKQQFQFQMDREHAKRDLNNSRIKAQRDAQMQQLELERQAQIKEREAQANIAVKQAEAQAKAELDQQKFLHEQARDAQKFEFDKKLEMMKLWCQCQGKMGGAKGDGEGGGMSSDPSQPDLEDMMRQEGGPDLPEQIAVASPLEKTLAQIADSQSQMMQMMQMCMQQMTDGHQRNAQMMTDAMMHSAAMASAPRRQRVIREPDEQGIKRVVGVETMQ